MSIDIKELKRLARKVAELEDRPEIAEEHSEAADALWLHMHCHTILGLIEEIERRDENPNFRAVQSARQETEKLRAENEALRKAAESGRDALEVLRRGHGVDVGAACYPALNLLRDALDGEVSP